MKSILGSNELLVHFDLNLEITLACDASQYGIELFYCMYTPIKFVNSVDNGNANALSRLSLNDGNIHKEIEETYLGLIEWDIRLIQGPDIKMKTQMECFKTSIW